MSCHQGAKMISPPPEAGWPCRLLWLVDCGGSGMRQFWALLPSLWKPLVAMRKSRIACRRMRDHVEQTQPTLAKAILPLQPAVNPADIKQSPELSPNTPKRSVILFVLISFRFCWASWIYGLTVLSMLGNLLAIYSLLCLSVLFVGATLTCMLYHLRPAHLLWCFAFSISFVTLCLSVGIFSHPSLGSLILSSAKCLFPPNSIALSDRYCLFFQF